jgi:hypothetical protein
LSGRKEAAQMSDVERINLKKVTEIEVREYYQFRICNGFADLENSDNKRDINRV